jgi:deazaflavin-dependent oxidoreductase (nitroreductase family)
MAAEYRLGFFRRTINALVRAGLRLGLGEKNTRMLTVAGRKTGKPMSTPVTLVVEGDREWIVAPYGERQWVKNLRASGRANLARGRSKRDIRVREVSYEEAVPVMRAYVNRVPVTRKYWEVAPDSSDEAYLEVARKHPVFAVDD